MADIQKLFDRATENLNEVELRQTKTQEVLQLKGGRGFAWRWLTNPNVIQLYPPTAKWTARRAGSEFVVTKGALEVRYRDPEQGLILNKWSYVGCANCSDISDHIVWSWIRDAHDYLRRDKG